MNNENNTTEEIVVEDNQIICALTDAIKPAKSKEQTLQSLIAMLNEEYGFEMNDMERDFSFTYTDADGKTKRTKIDLVVFEAGKPHDSDGLIRVCIVNDDKTKAKDSKKGVEATLQTILEASENCEFGLWTNGDEFHFLQREMDEWSQVNCNDISDFPGAGQTIEDLEKWADKIKPRKPANDSLIRAFKRCHDYIYGNEGMKKTAFWELLNLIFCKIYDEKRRFMPSPNGESYRRKFWVGVKEQNSEEGLKEISKRIKRIFEDLKTDPLFSEVFDGNEQINLSDRGLAFVAGELAKYSFLDATVDVKGTAYETIVSNTLKQEAGQFFTPRNLIRCMVEMMDPTENMRVLDPACGSGGFLTVVLDHVRKKITEEMYPELSGLYLTEKYNSYEVNERVKIYAEKMIFGFDFDPDLKKAARMNMVMAGDGHANISNINSLDYPYGPKTDELEKIKQTIQNSIANSNDRNVPYETDDAREKFDLIFTNPPFGAKVEVDFEISKRYELGHNWSKDTYGNFQMGNVSSSEAPEVLFIEQCYNFLKPGGRLAIVLPDGILGNPNTEYVRDWILKRFKLLASIDLPVETFLPQVGVQASLLFLQKKTQAEREAAINGEDYEVFMAIAESIGKDRRGVPIYKRDEDGAELLFDDKKEVLLLDNQGSAKLLNRKTRVKKLDDDLPSISKAYLNFIIKINQ
ncbi:MAG TPA: N-6 DNA methylase [Rikenellaceae bacterium]|nr:MAG: N-6 DNA methylase [Bacteroidetes bacterium GWE2_40_15]HBZ25646.1 N-6 DNA methylase [Rikenellaceae bacterium]